MYTYNTFTYITIIHISDILGTLYIFTQETSLKLKLIFKHCAITTYFLYRLFTKFLKYENIYYYDLIDVILFVCLLILEQKLTLSTEPLRGKPATTYNLL